MNAGNWRKGNEGQMRLAAIAAIVMGLSIGWASDSAWGQQSNPRVLRFVIPDSPRQNPPSPRPRPLPWPRQNPADQAQPLAPGTTWIISSNGDPAAHRIDFQTVSVSDPAKNTGVVRIVGVVKNVGPGSFPYGGTAALYQFESGGGFYDGEYVPPAGTLLAKVAFQNLGVGQEVCVTAHTKWPLSSLNVVCIKLIVATHPDNHGGDRGDNNVLARPAIGFLKDFPPSSVQAAIPNLGYSAAQPVRRPIAGQHRIIP